MNTGEIRSDIQAMRALAVLAVVVCHMNPAWLPGGYLGVDIFFVISGFVITQILLKKQGNFNLGSFYLKRFFRIVPAYAFMLTVVASLAALIFLPENFSQFVKSWLKSLTFTSNQYFSGYGDYFSPALTEQPLLHTWSLAVEIQFYLLYPLVILLALKYRLLNLMLPATLLGFIYAQWIWMQADSTASLYYALHLRVPEFLLGCSLAIQVRTAVTPKKRFGLWLVPFGFFLIITSLIFVDEHRFNPLTAFVVCFGVAIVIAGRVEKGFLSVIYKNKIVHFIGALSYSIYLWHWPLLSLARYAYGEVMWDLPLVIIYTSAVLGVAWLSWELIEKKFRFKDWSGNRSSLLKGISFVGLMAVLPVTYAKQLNALVPPTPVELMRYADPETICHGKMQSSCVRGAADNQQVLLIGDSHAAQLNLAADVTAKTLGIGVEVISASSCIPLIGFNVGKLPSWAQKDCLNQIDVVSERLEKSNVVVLAGMWSYQFKDTNFPEVLLDFINKAKRKKQKVFVLAQIPKLLRNPARLDRMRVLGIDLNAALNSDWSIANGKLAALLSANPEVIIFSPADYQLFATPPNHKNEIIYSDEHHLNEVGSKKYGVLLAGLLKSKIPNAKIYEQ